MRGAEVMGEDGAELVGWESEASFLKEEWMAVSQRRQPAYLAGRATVEESLSACGFGHVYPFRPGAGSLHWLANPAVSVSVCATPCLL